MPLDKNVVKSMYDSMQQAGLTTKSMPDWAAERNAQTGTDDYNAGLQPEGWWTKTSHWLDTNVFDPVAKYTTEPLFGAIGGAFGNEQAGRDVGRSLPRAVVESAPMYLLGPEAGIPTTAALMGAHTYADTGSGKAAAISAATGLVLPEAGRYGGNLLSKALGVGERVAGRVATIEQDLPSAKFTVKGLPINDYYPVEGQVGQFKAARFAGSQAAQIAVNQASIAASDHVLGSPYNPLSPNFWLQQLPFTAIDAVHAATGATPTSTQVRAQIEASKPILGAAAGDRTQEMKTEFTPAKNDPAKEAVVDAAMSNLERVVGLDSSTPKDRSDALTAVINATADPTAAVNAKADAPPPAPANVVITGHARQMPNGNWKVLVDPDRSPDVVLPDHQNVWVNGKPDIVKNDDGTHTFTTTSDQVNPNVNSPILPTDPKDLGPDLPVQKKPAVDPLGQTDAANIALQWLAEKPQTFAPDEERTLASAGIVPREGALPEEPVAGATPVDKTKNLVLDSFHGPIQMDAAGNVLRLGNTDVGKDGLMDRQRFEKASQLPKSMIAAMELHYPEAFQGDKVNATTLIKGVQERPMLETKELSSDTAQSAESAARAQAIHRLDTQWPGWQDAASEDAPTPELAQLAHEVLLGERDAAENPDAPKYSFISPETPEKMVNYTERLERIPSKTTTEVKKRTDALTILEDKIKARGYEIQPPHGGDDATHVLKNGEVVEYDDQPADVQQWANEYAEAALGGDTGTLEDTYRAGLGDAGVKFRGPHFGPHDTNVVSSVRTYEDPPDPTKPGEKTVNLIENQSDWAQRVRENGERDASGNRKFEDTTTHPILDQYENISLKSFINKALESGATKVFIPDAETAMMTEEHDSTASIPQGTYQVPELTKLNPKFSGEVDVYQGGNRAALLNKQGGTEKQISRTANPDEFALIDATVPKKVGQELGMRQHYDVNNPSIMEKLTGVKGVKVEKGLHAKVAEYTPLVPVKPTDIMLPNGNHLRGSPVFKDANGNPKTKITGWEYSLDKIRQGREIEPTASIKQAVELRNTTAAQEAATRARLKEVAQEIEQTQSDLQQIQTKIDAVPNTPEDVIPRLNIEPNNPEHLAEVTNAIAEKLEEGADGVQAMEDVVLQQQTPAADAALAKLQQLVNKGQRLTGQSLERAVAEGNMLLAAHEQQAKIDPEGDSARIIKIMQNAMRDAQVKDPQFPQRILTVLYKWNLAGGTDVGELQRSINLTIKRGKLTPSKTIDSLLDVNGKRKYGTEAELQQFIEQNPDKVRPGDKVQSRKNRKGETKYFIGRRVLPIGEGAVSLDQQVGEGTTTLGDMIPESSTDIPTIAPDKIPIPSVNELASKFDLLLSDPTEFVADLLGEEPSKEQMLDVLEELGQTKKFLELRDEKGVDTPGFLPELNKRLRDAGMSEFGSKADMNESVKRMSAAVFRYDNGLRNWSMKSSPVYNPELAKTVGFMAPDGAGAKNWLTWFVNHPDASFYKELVGDLMGATKFDDLHIILPGDPNWKGNMGWHYRPVGPDGRPMIQYGNLPRNEAEAFNDGLKLAHETMHHVTKDLSTRADAPAIQLRATLQSLLGMFETSRNIPKPIRDAIRTAKAKGWYRDYQQGKISADTLVQRYKSVAGDKYSNVDHYDTFYAAQSPTELLAQIFNSPAVVTTLMDIRTPKTPLLSGLKYFAKSLASVMGSRKETENAYEDILSKVSNYLSTATNPSAYNGRNYFRDYLIAKGVKPAAMLNRLQTLENLYNTGDISHSVNGFQYEMDAKILPGTTPSGELSPVIATALKDQPPQILRDHATNLLAGQVPVHEALAWRLKQDMGMVLNLAKNIKAGLIQGHIPEGLIDQLTANATRVRGLEDGVQKNKRAIEQWKNLNNFTEEGFTQLQAQQLHQPSLPQPTDPTGVQDIAQRALSVADYRKAAAEEQLAGRKPMGWFTRNVMLTQFVKLLHPEFAAVANHVREAISQAIERITTLNLAYSYNKETGKFDPNIMKSHDRIAQNDHLTRAASDIKLLVNEYQKTGTQFTWDAPGIQKILSKFNQKDQDAIRLEYNSEAGRRAVFTEQTIPQAMTQINTEHTAKVIMAYENGMLPAQARSLAAVVYDALGQLQDPDNMQNGMALLSQLKNMMQANTFQKVLGFANQRIAQTNKFLTVMRRMPNYVSEQRFDGIHVIMRGPNGEPFRAGAKTDAEAAAIRDRMQKRGWQLLDVVNKSDTNALAGGLRDDVRDAMQEIDVHNYTSLQQVLAGLPPDVVERILPATQRTAQYEAVNESFKPVPNLGRKLVAGREYLNMLENQHTFYIRANNWLRHRMTDATTSLDMLHPELLGNQTLRQFAAQHVENSLTPDNPFFRKLVEATYYQRMAFSLGNSLLESLQNLTTGMQAIISETGSVSDAFGLWGKAVKNIMQYHVKGKWSTPELQEAMDKAGRTGVVGLTTWSDIYDPDRASTFDILHKKGGPAVQAGQTLKYWARNWATFFQRHNDRIGMLAGLDLAKQKGMVGDEAFEFARDLKERGLYSGGKAQRPVGLWSIDTKPVPQMLSSLQTYTLGWFSQMGKDWQVGFGKPPPGMTETQRVGARKAFIYGLAAQAAMAGALGLPGVGQGMALVKQATGLDLKGWLRQNLAKLFDEDTDNGGMFTNIAMRGGLAGLTPIDPSNRASISFPFTGIDPYKGFDVSQLLGAPGATVSDVVKGLLSAAQGDAVGFQKMLPTALKAPVSLIQGEGDVRDSRGALLQQLTPAQRVMSALGLPSSKVQAARDSAEAVKDLNAAALREKESFLDTNAQLLQQGRANEVRQAIEARQKQNPTESARDLARGIIGRVQAQTVPADLRRNVNPGVDIRGLQTGQAPAEGQRTRIQQAMAGQLGLPIVRAQRAQDLSNRMDDLMSKNPLLTIPEARDAARGTGRVRRHDSLLTPATFQ